ncbi:unnamed protein product (macronuclear) [Paramecium tetraurelia]|uniref:EGF-like domain-containing protein n=1 Tax=Paramecium tetraurelia TaxID=5888 RepID=A0DXX4_PARTE|nr:uncharacterized protein GSPATT00021515001 [Paramecium tetraurelia]CAK87891.1 unnamed protein product [Paramecium tetraurelia]|eukprot:XP_001455288.1 hypothetical protein (macronuclear) [Paramecium tetraurelia strain d4-2]
MKHLLLFYFTICFAASQDLNIKLPSQMKLLQKLRENRRDRNLEDIKTSWEPIRIHFEYVETPPADYIQQTETVLEIIKTFFGRHLLVKRQTGSLEWKSTYETDWGLIIVPASLQKSYDSDLVFFVAQETDADAEYVARAGPVIFDEKTGRPIFGLMILNNHYMLEFQGTNAKFEAAVQVVLHETIHGLGFTNNLYDNYINSTSGQKYDFTVYQRVNQQIDLPTPRLTQLARKHFGCCDLFGGTMEDQNGRGTAGSHFERSIFHNDLMTGSMISGNTLFTDFTFAILEDTGFYRVTKHASDVQLWGLDKGCDFYQQQCYSDSTYEEFCENPYDPSDEKDNVANHLSCSYAQTGIGFCVNDGLVECPYYYIIEDLDCRDADNYDAKVFQGTNFHFGYDSMCIRGGLPKKGDYLYIGFSCFQYSCDEDHQLSIIVDGTTYDCSDGGSIPSFDDNKYLYGFMCPDNPEDICQSKNECPNQCNKKGYCLGGVCTCIPGYAGRACEKACTTYRDGIECVQTCPANTFANDLTMYCIGCPANCATCSALDVCTLCEDTHELVAGFCELRVYSLMLVTSFIALFLAL